MKKSVATEKPMSKRDERKLLKAWDQAHDLMTAWENASQEAKKIFIVWLATDEAHEGKP